MSTCKADPKRSNLQRAREGPQKKEWVPEIGNESPQLASLLPPLNSLTSAAQSHMGRPRGIAEGSNTEKEGAMSDGAWIVAWEGPHMLARRGGGAQEAIVVGSVSDWESNKYKSMPTDQ